MGKAIYTGIDNKARKVPKLYVGVDGRARKVKKGYIGVGGVARLFYTLEPEIGQVSALRLKYPGSHYDEILRYYDGVDDIRTFSIVYQFEGPLPAAGQPDTVSGALFSIVVPNVRVYTASIRRDELTGRYYLRLELYDYDAGTSKTNDLEIPSGFSGQFNLSYASSSSYSPWTSTWGDLTSIRLIEMSGGSPYFGFLESPRAERNANVLIKRFSHGKYSPTKDNSFVPYKFANGMCGFAHTSADKKFYSDKVEAVML